ncbi:hypothetical protein LOZ58_002767 [Ophidiomyces ophidiicola]|nr:hypothetical protein LOZ58_002767 [Ophidiomyces ophidiicola]
MSMLPNGGAVLNIGFENYSKNSNTLATFGSDNADILVERRDISPTQCSFKVNWDTGVIMLRDHSVDQSTHVFELQQGSMEALMSKRQTSTLDICDRLLPQILSALDYLAYQNLIHRDVKPANILYSIQPNGRYHFYLADFEFIDNFGTTSNIGTRV